MQLASPITDRSLRNRAHARGGFVRAGAPEPISVWTSLSPAEVYSNSQTCAWLGIISQDPIGFNAGDANLYRYVGNKSTCYVDPTGLQEGAIFGAPVEVELDFVKSFSEAALPYGAKTLGSKALAGAYGWYLYLGGYTGGEGSTEAFVTSQVANSELIPLALPNHLRYSAVPRYQEALNYRAADLNGPAAAAGRHAVGLTDEAAVELAFSLGTGGIGRVGSQATRASQRFARQIGRAPNPGAVVDDVGGITTRLQRLGYDEAKASRIVQSIQNGEQVVVIGENMKRVGAVGRMVENAGGRAVTYSPRNFRSTRESLSRLDIEANRSWIRYWAKDKSAPVIDIGRQPTPRPDGPSPFYGVENRSLNRWQIYTPFSE